MQTKKTYGEQVIEECKRIETLARLFADAASRYFAAPLGDEDFETGQEGPEYSNAYRTLRFRMERTAQCLEGLDPQLDEELSDYWMGVLRADPKARQPLFQAIN
jgi:hypothetical protein